MFDKNTWSNQMNHAEILRDYTSYLGHVKDFSRIEQNEYMDLERRHDEQSYLVENISVPASDLETQISSKRYA